jgi:hypothetical protein
MYYSICLSVDWILLLFSAFSQKALSNRCSHFAISQAYAAHPTLADGRVLVLHSGGASQRLPAVCIAREPN